MRGPLFRFLAGIAVVLVAGIALAVVLRFLLARLLRRVLHRPDDQRQVRAASRGVFWFVVTATVLGLCGLDVGVVDRGWEDCWLPMTGWAACDGAPVVSWT